jgi:hypothetical protein
MYEATHQPVGDLALDLVDFSFDAGTLTPNVPVQRRRATRVAHSR